MQRKELDWWLDVCICLILIIFTVYTALLGYMLLIPVIGFMILYIIFVFKSNKKEAIKMDWQDIPVTKVQYRRECKKCGNKFNTKKRANTICKQCSRKK